MRLKSVWCEVEHEDGSKVHCPVPAPVFIYLRDNLFTELDMGMYTPEQVEELKNWKPGTATPPTEE